MNNPSSPQRRLFCEGDDERRRLEKLAAQGDAEAIAKLQATMRRTISSANQGFFEEGPDFSGVEFHNMSLRIPIMYYYHPSPIITFRGYGTNDPVRQLLTAAERIPAGADHINLRPYYPTRENGFYYLLRVEISVEAPGGNVNRSIILRWGDTHTIWLAHNGDNPAAVALFNRISSDDIRVLNITGLALATGRPPITTNRTNPGQ